MTKSEIRDKRMCPLSIFFLKLKRAENNFEKLIGWTVFENPNFSSFQFCPSVAAVVSVVLFNLSSMFYGVIFVFLLI